MSSPVPWSPVCPGAQGLTAGQERVQEAVSGSRQDEGRPAHSRAPTCLRLCRAESPKQILPLGHNKVPSPGTRACSEHPKTAAAPGREAQEVPGGNLVTPAVSFLGTGHMSCFHLGRPALSPTSASTGLAPGESRGRTHVPAWPRPPGACMGVTRMHISRGIYFWADPRGRAPSSEGVLSSGARARDMAQQGWPASMTPADSEQSMREGLALRHGGWEHSGPPWAPEEGRLALGARERGGGRAGVGRGMRSGGGNGKQGSASSSGHAMRRNIPSSFSWKSAVPSPGSELAWDRWAPAHRPPGGPGSAENVPEGSLGRPGLPPFLLLTTLAAAFSGSLPPQRHHPRRAGSPGELQLQPGGHSRCAQLGPSLPQSPGWTGEQAGEFYLPEEALAEPEMLREAARGAGEGSAGGRGLALPRSSPGRLCLQR